jgi:hypothetical protein
MTMTKSNKMKKLAVGAALTCLLGGGLTSVLVPSFASATVAKHSADDPAGHARHSADDPKGHAKHGADDPKGHARHGADDPKGHARHGADDPKNHG